MQRSISRTVDVGADPAELFELLAHPSWHAALDGSGTVRGALGKEQRLALGSRFGMRMRLGLPYRITNEVVDFEEGRRFAWRHFYRHVWRWEIEPIAGGCRVTETFEWGNSLAPFALEAVRLPARNAHSIDATLARLRERFGAPTGHEDDASETKATRQPGP